MDRTENTSSDWGSWYTTCPDCGATYHASEGCDCRERRAEEDERAEAVLARLPSDLAARVRRMIEEIGGER
jgi:hypothetical protein